MKKYCWLLFSYILIAEITAAQKLKFDFGNGRVAKNYISITPHDMYDSVKGYGFEPGCTLQAVERNAKPVTGDFITSKTPFSFSVNLPDGNYDVSLTLGDAHGVSSTTVRAECRRLMLEHVVTGKGAFAIKTFTVHVKDSLIRAGDGAVISKVKLKPRERSYYHWDNMLTIEFNDSMPKVCAVEIEPNTKATTIFLAGNSTVVDQDKEPWAAWGQMFPVFFKPGVACVANYAESGETLKAFKGERRLEKIWGLAKPGDYLFIEFAHNDQKAGSSHLDPFTTYTQVLTEWIKEARLRQMIPVLVTSMHRRNFDSTGHIVNTLSDYPEAMRKLATEQHVQLIDLNAMSKILYEAWGVEKSIKAFVHFPAATFPGQDKKLEDNTHFSTYGAYQLARCVVESIRKSGGALASKINPLVKPYNPSLPPSFESFYWPPALFKAVTKPDGN